MAKWRVRPKARADFDDIWIYTHRTWGLRQARRYLSELRDFCTELAGNPALGKPRDDLYPGLRVYPAGRHLIFYLQTGEGIDIVRILHERMDVGRHLP